MNSTMRIAAVREIARMRARIAGCEGRVVDEVGQFAAVMYQRDGSAHRALTAARTFARQRARQWAEGIEVDEHPAVEEVTLWTDPHLDADWGPTKDQVDHAERVRDEIQPWHQVAHPRGFSIDEIDHVISASDNDRAREIRQGRTVIIEYIGMFEQLPGGGVRFVADPELLRPWPTQLHAVPAREEAA